MDLEIPKTRDDIARIQSDRKRVALAQARKAPFYRGKLDGVREDRLDDPAEWAKIPILDKASLRELSPERFMAEFCIAAPGDIAEYWRSGGATGVPLYYPRSFAD
jgi:phenylacetate-CoA ligase